MKKIIALAFAGAAVFSLSAQNCKEMYESAKKLDDLFNKEKPTMMEPNKELSLEAAQALMEAFELYNQVIECEKVPNAKGKVENKLTKKVEKALVEHALDGDYNKAAIVFFNNDRRFPEAYTAFMLSGVTSAQYQTVPDTVYATDFFNAGNSAFGTDFIAAAEAYAAARMANTSDPQVYLYEIASLQQQAAKDSTFKANDRIVEVAKAGVERFGASNEYVFATYIQDFLDKEKLDEATTIINGYLASDPNNASLYRLRAIVSNAKHQYLEAIPDFEKVAEYSDNYEYVRGAANNVNNIGKYVMGQLPVNPSAEQKAQILGIFQSAKKIAEKAMTLPDKDDSAARILDDINYNIENAEKL